MLEFSTYIYVLIAAAAGGIVIASIALIKFILGFGRWQGLVDADRYTFRESLKELKKSLEDMKESFNEFRVDITKILVRLPPTPIVRMSPLQLTELGESISGSLKIKDWAKKLS